MNRMLWVVICCFSMGLCANEKTHDIAIDIKMICPESAEYEEFVKSIPPPGNYSTSFEEWKSSFVKNMTQLIQLVESEKIYNSSWSVRTDITKASQTEEN